MNIKVFTYGTIWLLLLSPFSVWLLLGSLSTQPYPTLVEMIGVLAGSYFYWEVVWVPVRIKFETLDVEFCKMMGWSSDKEEK
ncbi:TMhelix containing protein [Vibrio phage 1.063.O._10N.261.45.C7]|nr:TMhelix containing protein [Vibrio phage 1.063.O._10N.261.45.C7]